MSCYYSTTFCGDRSIVEQSIASRIVKANLDRSTVSCGLLSRTKTTKLQTLLLVSKINQRVTVEVFKDRVPRLSQERDYGFRMMVGN